MKRILLITAALFTSHILTSAQTETSTWEMKKCEVLNHLDLSVTTGSTGLGIDLASPIGDKFRVRAGFSFIPHISKVLHFGVQVGKKAEGQTEEEFNEQSQTKFEKLAGMLEEFTGYKVDNQIDMRTTPTYYNFNLLVDFFPIPQNKHWHVTAGVYLGNRQIGKSVNTTEDMPSLLAVGIYNNLYEKALGSGTINFGTVALNMPDDYKEKLESWGSMSIHIGEYAHDILYSEDEVVYYPEDSWYEMADGNWEWHEKTEVMYTIKAGDPNYVRHKAGDPYRMVPDDDSMAKAWAYANRLKPYVGFGYEGRLLKGDDRWQIGFDAGVMFWGGAPKIVTHDGTDLANDVRNVRGRVGDYVNFIKKFEVFPVLNLRITRRLF